MIDRAQAAPIDLVWNFPLLPTQGAEWQTYLERAVRSLHVEDPVEMRPSFRGADADLRVRAARWLGSDPALTWFTCGGHHAALVSLFAADLPGKGIAVERVTYGGIIDQAKMLRSELVPCAYDAEGMRPESLDERCRNAEVRAAFLMPTAHNPLGCTMSLERREAIVKVARKHDILLIEDDAYGYMVPDAAPSFRILAPERTFYFRGLAKSISPQTRTGFLVVPERFSSAVEPVLKNTTTGTSLAHNLAAMLLIEDGAWQRNADAKLVEGRARNAAAREILGDAASAGPACAWHLWVCLPEESEVTALEVSRRCLERGVIVSPADGFTPPGLKPERALRLALGGELERETTLEGVRLVHEVLQATTAGSVSRVQ
ncbi:aminotransferase-like domain-containing protein [Bryocella elongata]|nr:PLP-dependent aminotransferase family protein [Bryocella elongata]